ncbi:uncharacterized protein Tco025E_08866, partial [Trypanosoma conorhini]
MTSTWWKSGAGGERGRSHDNTSSASVTHPPSSLLEDNPTSAITASSVRTKRRVQATEGPAWRATSAASQLDAVAISRSSGFCFAPRGFLGCGGPTTATAAAAAATAAALRPKLL